MTNEQIKAEIAELRADIEKLKGFAPKAFRLAIDPESKGFGFWEKAYGKPPVIPMQERRAPVFVSADADEELTDSEMDAAYDKLEKRAQTLGRVLFEMAERGHEPLGDFVNRPLTALWRDGFAFAARHAGRELPEWEELATSSARGENLYGLPELVEACWQAGVLTRELLEEVATSALSIGYCDFDHAADEHARAARSSKAGE